MLHFTLTLKKWNDSAKRHTVRYRVEVIQANSKAQILLVARLGWKGESCKVFTAHGGDVFAKLQSLFDMWEFRVGTLDHILEISPLISNEDEEGLERISQQMATTWTSDMQEGQWRLATQRAYRAWTVKSNMDPTGESQEFMERRMGELVLTYTTAIANGSFDDVEKPTELPLTPVQQQVAAERTSAAYLQWGAF